MHSSLAMSYTLLKYITAGVGCCLFAFRHSRASVLINERPHTFFILNNPLLRSEGDIISMVEGNITGDYVSPIIQMYEIQSEGVLCNSNENVGENEGTEWD